MQRITGMHEVVSRLSASRIDYSSDYGGVGETTIPMAENSILDGLHTRSDAIHHYGVAPPPLVRVLMRLSAQKLFRV